MPVTAGALLGPYEILAPIGAGGMGEVYKARDTRLDRIVAIKVAQTRFSERFEREARAVAALNHPNICQLYDVGPNYLVMEYVEGSPVAPTDNARRLLDLAVQIADGLAAAHAVRIVHRDLKPDNILVTSEGRVKILDFGLAKAAAEPRAATEATLTMITDPGTTVGTINYMSPEQARGETNLTAQSDQFSFGLVLYELAAGKRAFQRASAPETMAAIIREEAEPLPAGVPMPLRWVIERLLAKDPSERYESTRDLYRELRQIRERRSEAASAQQIPAGAPGPVRRKSRSALWLPALGIALGLAAGIAIVSMSTPPPQADLSRYKFTAISQTGVHERYPAWSPDGKSVAYAVNVHGIFQIFVKTVGSSDAAQLTHSSADCAVPFWSRDGATIYYRSGGELWGIEASGGNPERVMDGMTRAALHPDGKTVAFLRNGSVWLGPLRGKPEREFWKPPRQENGWMGFSADGSKLGVINGADLWIVPYPSGTPRNVGLVAVYGAAWFPDSRHLLVADETSTALEILDSVDSSRRVIIRSTDQYLDPSLTPDGKKAVYTGGANEWDVMEISIPEGHVPTVVGGAGIANMPDWAPSGTHFLFARRGVIEDQSLSDGFVRRLAVSASGTALTFSARWSPDGTRLLFFSRDEGKTELMVANASGGKQRLFKVRPVAGSVPEVLGKAAPELNNYEAIQWSPKGDWILYSSGDGMSMVSPDGDTVRNLIPHKLLAYGFSKDGSQVLGVFQNTTGEGAQWQLYSADVKTGKETSLGALDLPPSTDQLYGFSLHPDGKRFLTSIARWPYNIWMIEGFDQPQPGNWLERLLQRGL